MNYIALLGRLTRDPETRATTTSSVTSFNIAVQRKMKNRDGEYESDFINCTAFGKTGEFVTKYFHKGSRILLSGTLQVRHYDDKDGNKRTAYDVIVNEVDFVDQASSSKPVQEKAQHQPEPAQQPIQDDTSLPFDI